MGVRKSKVKRIVDIDLSFNYLSRIIVNGENALFNMSKLYKMI